MKLDPRLAELARKGCKEYVATAEMIMKDFPKSRIRAGHEAQKYSNLSNKLPCYQP